MSSNHYIGVDLGGTKILAGVFDRNLKCLVSDKNKTKAALGYSGVKERIIETIKGALHLSGTDISNVKGIGIGAPGTISKDGESVLFAPNLDWREVPLKADIEVELGCPVWLGNDCSVATMGIHRHELDSKHKNMICIFLGTGIGGGIISNGVMLKGETQAAGEVGHMVLDPKGPLCGCGVRGCYEALASRTAIYNKIKNAVENGEQTVLVEDGIKNLTKIRSGKLRRAVEAGDRLATKVLDETCFYSGIAIANLCNLLNPEVIVMGGGMIAQMGETMLPKIKEAAFDRIMPGSREVRIISTKLGDDAGITGAAVLAYDNS